MEHTLANRRKLTLLLSAGGDRYAMDAADVVEILVSVKLVPLTGAPQGVVGLVNYHGRMLPVLDLCRVTTGRDCANLLSTRIVMLQYVPFGLVGLRAECVTEGVWADTTDFVQAEGGCDATYLRRKTAGRSETIALLSMDRLFPGGLHLPPTPSDIGKA
jgi:chemotaxis-related protein WspB